MTPDKSFLHYQALAAMKRAKQTTKRCARCKEWKSRSLFHKSRSKFDGLNCYCKSCIVWRARAYRKSDKGAEALRASNRKYRRANPEKRRARLKIKDYIHRGKVTRENCEVCGEENAQAHHEDYSKPLVVRWFCFQHHQLYHSKN